MSISTRDIAIYLKYAEKPNTKRFLRGQLKLNVKEDRLSASLSDKLRVHYDEDGYTEYGIIDARSKKKVIKQIEIPICNCPHDCCGHAFTEWIDANPLPGGKMSLIHRVGINV